MRDALMLLYFCHYGLTYYKSCAESFPTVSIRKLLNNYASSKVHGVLVLFCVQNMDPSFFFFLNLHTPYLHIRAQSVQKCLWNILLPPLAQKKVSWVFGKFTAGKTYCYSQNEINCCCYYNLMIVLAVSITHTHTIHTYIVWIGSFNQMSQLIN